MKYRVMPKLTSILLSVVVVTFIVTTNASPLFARTVLPSTSPAPTTYIRPLIASTTPIGISYGDTLFWDSASVLSQTLDDAVAVGITTIRLDLAWGDIQRACEPRRLRLIRRRRHQSLCTYGSPYLGDLERTQSCKLLAANSKCHSVYATIECDI